MKKRIVHLAFALVLTAVLGCSSLKVSQDYDESYDFSGLKTFAWETLSQPETGDARVDSPLIDQRIRTAVEEDLAQKGMEKAETGPVDFLVKYTYTIAAKIQSAPASSGVGIGYGGRGSMGGIILSTGTDVRQYDQGLLIIDFLAPDGRTLIWRGTSTRIVRIHAGPEKTTEDIDRTVEKLLAQFPPE